MSFQTFKSNWIGKRVDADGAYQYQCVDLIRQYLHDERGLAKTGAWGNAINYWTNPAGQVLSVCDKVAGSAASTGDIVILKGLAGNPSGHIGIATGGINASQVEILEQNGSSGNGDGLDGNAIRTRYVDRSRVAGLLRLKPTNNPPQGGNTVILTEEAVKTLYRRLFNREGDAGGVKNYTGKTLDFTLGDMLGSQEFKGLHVKTITVEKPVEVIKEVPTGSAATPKQLAAEKAVDALKDAFNK
jgi:hypothetical protein